MRAWALSEMCPFAIICHCQRSLVDSGSLAWFIYNSFRNTYHAVCMAIIKLDIEWLGVGSIYPNHADCDVKRCSDLFVILVPLTVSVDTYRQHVFSNHSSSKSSYSFIDNPQYWLFLVLLCRFWSGSHWSTMRHAFCSSLPLADQLWDRLFVVLSPSGLVQLWCSSQLYSKDHI